MTTPFRTKKIVRLQRIAIWILGLTTPYFITVAKTSAQCTDQKPHFRGGIWKQWIVQIDPTFEAARAVNLIVEKVNRIRSRENVPLLLYYPETPHRLIVGVFVENDPRGSDGNPLPSGQADAARYPNEEAFLATFVNIEGSDRLGVLFFANPLRSNGALNTTVPGEQADLRRTITFADDKSVRTKWSASHGPDSISFAAAYPDGAITGRSRWPNDSGPYLDCNLAPTFLIVYEKLPEMTFILLERNQSRSINLPQNGVDVKVTVKHNEPNILKAFDDKYNRPARLYELDRVVRFVQVKPPYP